MEEVGGRKGRVGEEGGRVGQFMLLLSDVAGIRARQCHTSHGCVVNHGPPDPRPVQKHHIVLEVFTVTVIDSYIRPYFLFTV